MSERRTEPGVARARLRGSTRRGLVALGLALLAVYAVARRLEPSPTGYGTHTQLGLPPCHFAWVTGRPCPTCGMTTAFAWFVRGRLGESARANPAGCMLAASGVALVPWLFASAAAGRPLGARSVERPLVGLVVAAVALSLVAWTVRLVLGLGLG
jgi:hypothetical protein